MCGLVAHERLTEQRVTIEWLLAKPKSFSNTPAFLDFRGSTFEAFLCLSVKEKFIATHFSINLIIILKSKINTNIILISSSKKSIILLNFSYSKSYFVETCLLLTHCKYGLQDSYSSSKFSIKRGLFEPINTIFQYKMVNLIWLSFINIPQVICIEMHFCKA